MTKKPKNLAQLIAPDGTPGMVVTQAQAIKFCREHPGWTWREVED
jgi:hypothetical protein